MSLFEKILNYQILSRLENTGTTMITSHERAWLKSMLAHPAAADAFHAGTLNKLQSILEQDPVLDISEYLIEKARSIDQQVYHPLLRPLRQYMMNKSGIRLTYIIKGDRINSNQSGVPYRMEYSMVKREWYLLWHHLRNHTFMRTRLKNILSLSEEPLQPADSDRILKKVSQTLESRRTESVIEVVRIYNKELSRILYAFSCFEKDVEYDAENDTYRIRVCLLGDEQDYLLSKIRFLGKRVRIIEGNYLKKRMLESSTRALERYGETASDEEQVLVQSI
ncbi:MAG: hypothetical protein K0Q73_5670 [Paenibacillus sp.]|nr:hypothetical protein [Paenibacillus sp.]